MNDEQPNLQQQSLSDICDEFAQAVEHVLQRIDDKWNALSKEDQLDYFCAVVRRIHRGEIEEQRSYRGVLYSVFEFGVESYAMAQMSGYLDIHNCIILPEEERKTLTAFAEQLGVDNPQEKVKMFFRGTLIKQGNNNDN